MLSQYYPVLLLLGVAVGIGIALILIGKLFGPSKPTVEKLIPYECGFDAFEDSRMLYSSACC